MLRIPVILLLFKYLVQYTYLSNQNADLKKRKERTIEQTNNNKYEKYNLYYYSKNNLQPHSIQM